MALKLLRHVHACKGGSIEGGLGQDAMCSWIASLPQVALVTCASLALPACALLVWSLVATWAKAGKARDCMTPVWHAWVECRGRSSLVKGQNHLSSPTPL